MTRQRQDGLRLADGPHVHLLVVSPSHHHPRGLAPDLQAVHRGGVRGEFLLVVVVVDVVDVVVDVVVVRGGGESGGGQSVEG